MLKAMGIGKCVILSVLYIYGTAPTVSCYIVHRMGLFRSFVFKGYSRHLSRRMQRYGLHPFLVYICKTAVEMERIGARKTFKSI